MRMRRAPAGSLPVRSAVIVRSRPAGKPMSSEMRVHVPSGRRASTHGSTAVTLAWCAAKTDVAVK